MPGGSRLAVRRYAAGDHDDVVALHRLALEDVGAAVPGPWNDDLDAIDDVYIRPGGEFLVGLLEGRIVAMGALRPDGIERAEIKRMRVHPDQQRRGFGRAILFSLEATAVRLDFQRLFLDTTTVQTGAIAFYQAHGYLQTATGTFDTFDVLTFEKELGDPSTREDER
jgi:GNAT superfamily N-acetyltransferase